jgi:AcrR family transcriptional regulator
MNAKTRQRLTPEARRSQLIAEATRLISEVGFRQFTIAELARACGITRAGVLHHFASKEEVLLAVLAARDRNDAEAVMADTDIHRGDVRRMLDLIVSRNRSQPEIIRLYAILSAEALDADHPAHQYFIDRWEGTIGWLASALDGLGRPGREAAVEVHSFMDGLQLNWLRDPSIDFTAQWAAFADDLFAHHPGLTIDLRRMREELKLTLPTLV